MLKIKINNTEIEYLNALETEEFYNGASRRTLTVTCEANAASVDALNALLTEQNLHSFTMANDELDVSNVYEGYVLKLECGIRQEKITEETPETPALYADRLVFKLGRRTYIEEKLHQLGL